MAVEGVADSGGSALLAPEEPRKRGRGRPLGCRDKGPRMVGIKPLGRPRKKKFAEVEKSIVTENPSAGEYSMDLGAYNAFFASIFAIVVQILELLKIIQASIVEKS
jgi:hypothetical protein